MSQRNDFTPWYSLLKRCYPVPDRALAMMLRADAGQFSQWKRGTRHPAKAVIQCCALLCLWRTDGLRSARDVVHLSDAIAMGKAEQIIDEYFAKEARRKARPAAK